MKRILLSNKENGWSTTIGSARRSETVQPNLFYDSQRLFEELCSQDLLKLGFKAVKKNKGSPGIDGITIEEFESHLDEELGQLQKELVSWTYRPKPVREVEIPKPGTTEKRKLGVPCIRDRVIQASMKLILDPVLDPTFSESSYGFRPGRNQKQAVEKAKKLVNEDKQWIVDIDLSKFFDRVHHDRLIARLSKFIADKRILRLVGSILRSGVMKNGLVSETTEGTTQGSPLSPLLSNLVLDELDKELERRGLEFCRFADDCNIFTKSKKAAERAMANATRFIEGKLKLVVNRDKSKIALSKHVKFLGMTVIIGTLAISAISMNRARTKLVELTPRGTHKTVEQTIDTFNKWYRGWSNYYDMTEYPTQLKVIESHFRRRMRSRIVDQQKSTRNLFNKLIKLGISRRLAAKHVFSNKGRWALSGSFPVQKAYNNKWFDDRGMYIASDRKLDHWIKGKWIKLT